MMEIQKALVHIGACESYKEAAEILVAGDVTLNGKKIDTPWRQLKGGYYAINVRRKAMYRFNIRNNKIGKVKEDVK